MSTVDQNPVFACRGLRKSFGGTVVLRDVTCAFPSHAISSLVGPSGTGKTTLMRVMLGLILRDRGEVLFEGDSVPEMNDAELARLRLRTGVLLEGPHALFGSMSLFENVAFPIRQHLRMSEDEVRATVMKRLDEVGLVKHADKAPETLSMGMRVRAAFARAVALEPPNLICDSPDYGMDPVRSALLYKLIQEMHGQRLESVILITHDMPGVLAYSEHIVVLHSGRVVDQGTPDQLRRSENLFTGQFIRGDRIGPLGMD